MIESVLLGFAGARLTALAPDVEPDIKPKLPNVVSPVATFEVPDIITASTVVNFVPVASSSKPNAPTTVPLIVTPSILIVLSSLIVNLPPAVSICVFISCNVESFV